MQNTRKLPETRPLGAWITWAGVLILLGWATQGTDLSLRGLFEGLGSSFEYLFGSPENPRDGFFPPDFHRLSTFVEQMLLTLKMALWGTAIAFVMAVPLGFLGARNTSPHPLIYLLTRRVMDLLRGLNEFVLALIFVAAVGLGPFPGILALGIHTAGILGKLFSEGIEDIDEGQVEALRSTGAHPI